MRPTLKDLLLMPVRWGEQQWSARPERKTVTAFFYRNLNRQYSLISHGEGVWLTDTNGNRYLDGCSGAVVSNIGHGVEQVRQAVDKQFSQVAFAHTSQFVCKAALELAERLVSIAPLNFAKGRAYFVSGGSESVETAIKMARGYYWETGQFSRSVVISRWGSYHGSTRGALSATGHPARRKPYLPLLSGDPHISAVYPYRCTCGVQGSCQSELCSLRLADELEQAIIDCGPENVMAFIAEPVVGAALGAAVPGAAYWPRIREICSKYNVLLIADEVMTGLGRVGAAFGCDLWNVQPDIIALGKGLSAGYLPLGAVLASDKVVQAFEAGSGVFEHGFTYSGHPVACSAGNAVMEFMIENQLLTSCSKREPEFFARMNELREFSIVGDVRGRGFLAGVELVENRDTKKTFAPSLKIGQRIAAEAATQGLLIYPGAGSVEGTSGDHFIVSPPFNISDSELDELFARLKRAMANVSSSIAALTV